MSSVLKQKNSNRQSFRSKLRSDKAVDLNLSIIHKKEEEESTERLADSLGMAYLNLQFIPINPDAIKILKKEQAQKAQMIIFQRSGLNLKVAIQDINNPIAKGILQKLYQSKYDLELYLVSKYSLEKGYLTYEFLQERSDIVKDKLLVPVSMMQEFNKGVVKLDDFADKINSVDTSELMQIICAGAITSLASDIHIEPKGDITRLRYRIDGVLQDILNFDNEMYKLLISRVKNLASLVLNIKTTAQDGRFSIAIKEDSGDIKQSIDVRVSILPSKTGEIIVMRLLNTDIHNLDIYSFGIRESFLDIIIRNLDKPQGMIMLSGPTGSGKTTSLYSFLNYVNRSETNIITIEDPIEYRLQNINQTQVDNKKGYTFANGLRAIVRQDPDVIMVGEIRDNETANISVNAAITGHLVFSTIHTNDSVGIITRLKEFGSSPQLIISAMNLFVAQRLVRRLCDCKEEYIPEEQELESIKKALAIVSPKSGVTIPQTINRLYRPKGCEKCYGLGYKGRLALYELFETRDNVKDLIINNIPEFKIFRKAIENGMVTLFQDGVLHAIDGETSLAEVLSVAGDISYVDEIYESTLTSALSRGIHIKKSTNPIPELNVISESMSIEDQLTAITNTALSKRATDIHLEPDMADLIIRFRIDGVLYEEARVPKSLYPQILTQIKIFAGLPLDIGNKIQEGRFTIFADKNFDVRVSIIPGGYGQTIVLRILRSDIAKLKLQDLGMDDYNIKLLQEQLQATTGLILVTGPTSAGKSTTLYATLNTLNQPGVKIITIEDPIEYKLSGILQTSINEETGYSFPNAIRALLRQNPNIVLIGEIRDTETAKVALQTAATGHLLLSTLHTNDAASAILRLYDLGIGLSEIATFVNVTIAQRIVRKIDPTNAITITLSQDQKDVIKSKLPDRYHSLIPDTILKSNSSPEHPNGYSGITAIFEVLVLNPKIKEIIINRASTANIKQLAIEEGMTTLEVSGILKVLDHTTDFEELERVLGIKVL
jgi:type II secretory ATPase GspE/PulE/Tfp pilus assembly ATPase PilB-like protein